ncbi:hypothetical protein F66182_6637 [Fusarium sp. NRRL 66182]|nr:hypothetical protein F66182_6637 [Fusarium sp. NRRL 66182]
MVRRYKQVRFDFDSDQEPLDTPVTALPKTPTYPTIDDVVILTWKDEECRFVINVLARFLKPLEIPNKTHLVEHRPWNAGGIYTIHSLEPILPNAPSDLAVRVKMQHHDGLVEVYLAITGGFEYDLTIPPVQWLNIPPMELTMVNGVRVLAQIEDSVHGQWLAACIQDFDLLALREGTIGLIEEAKEEENGEVKLECVYQPADPMDVDTEESEEGEEVYEEEDYEGEYEEADDQEETDSE